jgi:glyoxylase-like metal-dependent hydrolase (beta-lactamase superfamily II)
VSVADGQPGLTDGRGVVAPLPVAEGVTLIRCPNPGPMTLDGTNTYVLAAAGGQLIVDPGPADPDHLAAVAAAAAGGSVRAIVLTHGHADHSGGAAALSELIDAPVLARSPEHGGKLPAAGGVLAEVLTVLDAPGHSSDSVCFLYRGIGTAAEFLLTGDTILGRGTTVVAHPDGRLADYLRTLDLLRIAVAERDPRQLLPGHGPIREQSADVVDFYRRHRLERLADIRAALAAGHTTPRGVVACVYGDVDPVLWAAAELSVRAQLDYLGEQSA